jgi:hypothetical protein
MNHWAAVAGAATFSHSDFLLVLGITVAAILLSGLLDGWSRGCGGW